MEYLSFELSLLFALLFEPAFSSWLLYLQHFGCCALFLTVALVKLLGILNETLYFYSLFFSFTIMTLVAIFHQTNVRDQLALPDPGIDIRITKKHDYV